MSRPRLVAQLNEGLRCKLTLVAAPAGFGKTTLLSQWIASCARPTAWLSLSEDDGEATKFLAYLVAALQTISPTIGESVMGMLQAPRKPPTEAMFTTLLNEITMLPEDLVLVLDDYHLVDSAAVDGMLTFVLDHLPPQLHIVIATREDPQLPLARLRARAELAEIRAADLRFSFDEAVQYLNIVMDLHLSKKNIAALETRTEGWITGLHLAATSMLRQHDVSAFIDSFTGSHRFVMDYLVEEMLQQQSPGVQSFLLHTSILDRLCGPLCDAVTRNPEAAGQDTLEDLERANLLIVPLDDQRRWYRYHHLFAEVLRTQLLKEQPAQMPELHRRAAAWYEQHDAPSEAIRHALAGGDFEQAARLLEVMLPEVEETSNWHRWRNWIKLMPDDLLRSRPVLSAGYAWALLTAGELEAAEDRLRDAERWLESSADVTSDGDRMVVVDEEQFRLLPASLATARAFQAQARGDLHDTANHARRALDLVEVPNHPRRRRATTLLGLSYWSSGDLEATYQTFREFRATLRRGQNGNDAIALASVLADLGVALGRLQEAAGIYEQALQLVAGPGSFVPIGIDHIYRGISELHLEWGDRETAAQHLTTARELGRHAASPDWPYRALITEAQLAQANGDLEGALDLLTEAQRRYIRTPLPDLRPIAALKARVWIRQAKFDEALTWARDQGLDAESESEISYLREFEYITLARVLITQYRHNRQERTMQAAMGLVRRLLQGAREGGRIGSVIEILLLQALAHEASGALADALPPLRGALALAEEQGYVRIFADEGPPMLGLLQEASQQAIFPYYVQTLRTALGDGNDTGTGLTHKVLVEPLSEREREVLGLLATELSGPQIARELTVSLHTVRSHTKNIYGKLGASNRRMALRVAEELELL